MLYTDEKDPKFYPQGLMESAVVEEYTRCRGR